MCNRCREWFPSSALTFQAGGNDPVNLCAACHATVAREWNRITPNRGARYQRTYGISLEDHAVMYVRQGGLCAICRSDDPLVVDHHHGDGRVRGLLCGQCNTALGMLKDCGDVARSAARYLDER